jgi:hypothetical protein
MFACVFFGSLRSIRFTTIWPGPLHGQFYALQPGQLFGFDVGVNVACPGCADLKILVRIAQAW